MTRFSTLFSPAGPRRTLLAVAAVLALAASACGGGGGDQAADQAATPSLAENTPQTEATPEATSEPVVTAQPDPEPVVTAQPDPEPTQQPATPDPRPTPSPDPLAASEPPPPLCQPDQIGVDGDGDGEIDACQDRDEETAALLDCPDGQIQYGTGDSAVCGPEDGLVIGAPPEEQGVAPAAMDLHAAVCGAGSPVFTETGGAVTWYRAMDDDGDGQRDECAAVALAPDCGAEVLRRLRGETDEPFELLDLDSGEVDPSCITRPGTAQRPTPEPAHDHEHPPSTPEPIAPGNQTIWTTDEATGAPVVSRLSPQGSTILAGTQPVDYIPAADPVVLAAVNTCTYNSHVFAVDNRPGVDPAWIVERCLMYVEHLAPVVKHLGVTWSCGFSATAELAESGGILNSGARAPWWNCPTIAWDCGECAVEEKARQVGGKLEQFFLDQLRQAQQTGDPVRLLIAHMNLINYWFEAQGLENPVREL